MRNMLPRANWLRAITYARLVMKMEECGRWILPIAAFQYPLKDCMNLMGFAALTPNNPIRTPLPPCVANDSPLPMRPTSFLSILVLTIFILQQGCVSTEPPRLKTSQLSEEERTSIPDSWHCRLRTITSYDSGASIKGCSPRRWPQSWQMDGWLFARYRKQWGCYADNNLVLASGPSRGCGRGFLWGY